MGRFRESDLLGHVFETVLRRCIEEGWSAVTALRSTAA
jgi:transposase